MSDRCSTFGNHQQVRIKTKGRTFKVRPFCFSLRLNQIGNPVEELIQCQVDAERLNKKPASRNCVRQAAFTIYFLLVVFLAALELVLAVKRFRIGFLTVFAPLFCGRCLNAE